MKSRTRERTDVPHRFSWARCMDLSLYRTCIRWISFEFLADDRLSFSICHTVFTTIRNGTFKWTLLCHFAQFAVLTIVIISRLKPSNNYSSRNNRSSEANGCSSCQKVTRVFLQKPENYRVHLEQHWTLSRDRLIRFTPTIFKTRSNVILYFICLQKCLFSSNLSIKKLCALLACTEFFKNLFYIIWI